MRSARSLRLYAVLEPAPADDAERMEALREDVDEIVGVLCDCFQHGPSADGGVRSSGEDMEGEARDAAA